jgi:hypothetical protein
MSTEYTTITDRAIAVLEAEREDSLSDDLSADVVSVSKGQYVPGSAALKPCVRVRLRRVGLIADMAGGMSRTERLLLLVSGACVGATQDAACDDAANLMNNIENVMMNHLSGEIWGGNRFGWGLGISEENPEQFGEIMLEPGQDVTIAHFQILWSCDVRINTDPL